MIVDVKVLVSVIVVSAVVSVTVTVTVSRVQTGALEIGALLLEPPTGPAGELPGAEDDGYGAPDETEPVGMIPVP